MNKWEKWRRDLQEIGGWDNELAAVPAGPVREMIEEGDALAADFASMQMAYEAAHDQAHRMRERAIAAEARLAEAERDAALGRIAIKFVDRAGDYCAVDPPELICTEFYNAMAAEVERQRGELGLHTVTADGGEK